MPEQPRDNNSGAINPLSGFMQPWAQKVVIVVLLVILLGLPLWSWYLSNGYLNDLPRPFQASPGQLSYKELSDVVRENAKATATIVNTLTSPLLSGIVAVLSFSFGISALNMLRVALKR